MARKLFFVTCMIAVIASIAFARGEAVAEPVDAMVGARAGEGVTTFVSVSVYEDATGNTMPDYSEAPMLAAMVSSGAIPALDRRLPDDPSVVVPYEAVGQYGGTLTVDGTQFRHLLKRSLFMRDVNATEVIPDLSLGYDVNDDYTRFTIQLRPGTKWSDGEPFTSADIMFWWEDQINNDELTPGGPSGNFENAEISAVGDYAVQIDLSVPKPGLMASMSHPWTATRGAFYLPKHFQQQFHIDYNPDANDLAAEAGFETWVQLYNFYVARWNPHERPNIPVLNPWIVTEFTTTHYEAERNPYFWQVDTAGNQLPYIDNLIGTIVADTQTKLLQAIGGEVDYLSGVEMLAISDFPLLKENEAAGDYRVQTLKADLQTAFAISFNPVAKDPVLLEIFQDIRFRQALSIAMDRDALNESVFFGLATPRQIAPLPSVSFYDDSWSDYMTEYDVDRANELLDEMGLEWDAAHNLRVRSDGKPLNILMESGHGTVIETTVAEVLKAMWEEIGVTLTIKPEKLTPERLQSGELYEMGIIDGGGNATEMDLQGAEKVFWDNGMGGYSWNRWIATDGDDGTEPPQEWKDLAEKVERSLILVPGTDEWLELKHEIWDWRIKQLWHIGTVYGAPIFDVVGNDLHNVPSGFWFGWSIGFHPLLMTQQWYLDQ